ncbi:MATE family efflux transporter [Candidatus Peregrinibacteria bacterium]|nr:MATE family efflux transporter [Candidatus Peregrinibacteria bacterium]
MKDRSLPDYTKGPILEALIGLSLPIVFANILQTAYQLIDTFWVGRLGAVAVAAVSLSFPVIFLLISLGGGLAIAGTILVAQYKGQGNTKQVNYVSAQTLLLMLFISVLVTVVGYFISEPVMRLIGAGPQVLPAATSYLKISFLGMIFMFTFFVYQSLMRGVGDVKTPLYIVLTTVLLNLVLDPLFIMGWGPIPAYGVSGAALATIGTQGVAAIAGLILLFSGHYGIHMKAKNLRFDFPLFRRMLRLGFPASIAQSARALGLGVMATLVATFGTLTVASYGIGMRIFSFIIIPALGLSMAASTLIGQNLGARQKERAEAIAIKSLQVGFISLTLFGVILFFAARPIIAAFIPNDPAVIESGTQFVRIMALSFGFVGLGHTLMGVFTGAGDTKATMIQSILALWVFQFPLAYILSKHTSLSDTGIWWSFPISNVLAATVAYIWYKTGSWKHKQVIRPEEAVLQQEVLEEVTIDEGI